MDHVSKVEKVEQLKDGNIRVTVLMDKDSLSEEFVPYYAIKEELRKALLPVLTKEIMKKRKGIVDEVIKGVDWPDIVRSEVAQRVIKAIAEKHYDD